MEAQESQCDIRFDDNSNALVVVYNKLYRGETDRDVHTERTEIKLRKDDIFAVSIPTEPPPNPYWSIAKTHAPTEPPPNPYNPYLLGFTETHAPTYNYYKIIRIEDHGLNLICVEGSYDGNNVTWGQREITYLCEMLQLGRIKLGDEVPDPRVYMKVIEGGTTKKRRFIKSKKSKQSKQSKRSKRSKRSKKTKSKKARKSRRANRRHSRKH